MSTFWNQLLLQAAAQAVAAFFAWLYGHVPGAPGLPIWATPAVGMVLHAINEAVLNFLKLPPPAK